MDLTLTSSSEEDDEDIYVSSAARLKALKKKAPLVKSDLSKPDTEKQPSPDLMSFVLSLETSEKPSQRRTRNSSQNVIKNTNARNTSNQDEPMIISLVNDDDEDDDDDINSSILDKSLVDTLNRSEASVCIEDDNYNVDVKVRWKSRSVVRFEMRKYESFEKIFKSLAETEGVPEKQILILRDNKPVHKTDTPASIDLRIIDILEGGIVSGDRSLDEDKPQNSCKIKIQMSTKQRIVVELKTNDSFKTVVMHCAEQLNVSPSRIKLSLDGEDISLDDTPETLDLEQEACVDLRVQSF